MRPSLRATSVLLNVAHAFDHMFLLIFATAIATIAADFGFSRWEDLMPYGVGAFAMFGLGSLPAGRLEHRSGFLATTRRCSRRRLHSKVPTAFRSPGILALRHPVRTSQLLPGGRPRTKSACPAADGPHRRHDSPRVVRSSSEPRLRDS